MRALTVLHRWFGVAFCLLFAMWFATGAVMHWVAFPELTEEERLAGLAPLAADAAKLTPAQALAAFKRDDIARLRLVAAGGRAAYIATTAGNHLFARDAASGTALLIDARFALESVRAHATARGLPADHVTLIETAAYDQWTVSNGLDIHRPLFRIALNDDAGTEFHVSSLSGEVVRDSTRIERAFNYAGSVLHWIYPTALRKHWAAWDATVWWLSLVAMLGAMAGALLGILRLHKFSSPFRGWMYWHHAAGLCCATFVLTWILSGWLSMDHGRIFSDGRASRSEIEKFGGTPLTVTELRDATPPAAGRREIEWFRFAGNVIAAPPGAEDIRRAAMRMGPQCSVAGDNDAYAAHARVAGAPVYRIVCGDTWWQIDGTDGRVIEKLDASRRAYRWAFRALHTLDFPWLAAAPALRSAITMLLCVGGFFFSVTGAVIGWRRLKAVTGVI